MKLTSGIRNACLTITMAMAASAVIATDAYSAYPSGYYNSLEGKCGAELMKAVKNVVRNHTVVTYGENGTWIAFHDTDVKTVNGVQYWWDMYSNNNVSVALGHPGLNIEHSVANSWWGGTKNDAYNDLAHLNPSNSDANSRKSNYPMAELGQVTWDNGVTFIGRPKSGMGGGASYCYEPADEYKGDFARAFMYMFTVYNDISWRSEGGYGYMYDKSSATMFKPWAAQMLLKWSENDPPGEKEAVRNDGIYKHQKNRNPFIDLPHLADHIWGSKSGTPFYIDNSNQGGGNTDPDPLPGDETEYIYKWLGENDSDEGEWTFEDISLQQGLTYVWKWTQYNGLHYLNGSAYVNQSYAATSYAWSPEVSFENVNSAHLKFDHAAKFQTTLKSLCGLVVKDLETSTIHDVSISTWPTAGNWNFVSSGDIDLTRFTGKKVKIGFRYGSTESGADTWEIRNVNLSLTKSTAEISLPSLDEDSDDSSLVEVWGNNILAPEGARIFDLNGREVEGTNLNHGIYIVVKPTFRKSVKIII